MDKILTYTLREEDLVITADGLVNLILKNCVHITGHEVSRAKFAGGGITADGEQVTVKDRIRPGQTLRVALPEKTAAKESTAEKVPAVPAPPGVLRILYEDEDVIVLNKPSGAVVHPTHGHWYDTLGNYLADYYEKQGTDVVCHVAGRLDMDTSGALVFAKNRAAAGRLAKQRQDGRFVRTYHAIVCGVPAGEKGTWYTIDAPIERKPDTLMVRQVAADGGGERAVTHYRILASGVGTDGIMYTLAEFHIDTGRTHQIRVHMASIGHPLAGDPLYGGNAPQHAAGTNTGLVGVTMAGTNTRHTAAYTAGTGDEEISDAPTAESVFPAHAMLHAARIEFEQPFTGDKLMIDAPEPADFEGLKQEILTETAK